MRKSIVPVTVSSLMLCLTLTACGGQPANNSTQETLATESTQTEGESNEMGSTDTTAQSDVTQATASAVPNTIADDEDTLVATYPQKFTQQTYTDSSTGLSVSYNLFLPKDYDVSKSYPMVVFIADSTCANGDAQQSLTQGLGALVWATDEWQAAHPTIVCVPTYPETILDDHNGYTTTEYVELTKRLIDSVSSEYSVDKSRVYGTGQSMGCMTTLILASEHPDLYAACMFVDGQWDVSTLKGLEGQRFVYFAAEDDTSASSGMNEVMSMFDADSATYASAQWDGNWTPDQLTSAANELFAQGKDANFISWATGTITASAGNFAGPGGGGSSGKGGPSGEGGPSSEGDQSGEDSMGAAGGPSTVTGQAGGMGGVAYHMASFDYAYRCIAAMEWLFQKA